MNIYASITVKYELLCELDNFIEYNSFSPFEIFFLKKDFSFLLQKKYSSYLLIIFGNEMFADLLSGFLPITRDPAN